MTTIKSNHDTDLRLPQGPMVRAGKSVEVANWDIVKGNETVKAWLRAGAIEEVVQAKPKGKKSDASDKATEE